LPTRPEKDGLLSTTHERVDAVPDEESKEKGHTLMQL
jgi:hypothetical protein